MLRRLNSHVAEAIQPCCGGYTAMLWRLYSHVVEAIQTCCGGYTAILQRLYVFFTDNNITQQKLF